MPNYVGTNYYYTSATTASINTNYYYTISTDLSTAGYSTLTSVYSNTPYYYGARERNVKCIGGSNFHDYELKCDILVPDFTYKVSYEIRAAIGKFVRERFYLFIGTPKYEDILIDIANTFIQRLIKDNKVMYRNSEFVLIKK